MEEASLVGLQPLAQSLNPCPPFLYGVRVHYPEFLSGTLEGPLSPSPALSIRLFLVDGRGEADLDVPCIALSAEGVGEDNGGCSSSWVIDSLRLG